MFDSSLPKIADLGGLTARELIDAARGWARAENAAAAHKLAVMAEMFTRRTGVGAQDRDDWWVDPDAAVAAELAAALQVTQGLALHQTHRGVALRDRLPQVAALFAAGEISDLVVRKIIWRTGLITDSALMAAVDEALAGQAGRWGALSEKKVEQAIDATVIAHDPEAQRRTLDAMADRRVEFGAPNDSAGFTSLWARMYSTDGAALRDRIDRIAHTVCPADPRSIDQRRSDALGAIGHGLEALDCQCGADGCEAADSGKPVPNTTIYVIADAETIETAAEAITETEPAAKTEPAAETAETPAETVAETPQRAARKPSAAVKSKPVFLFGAGVASAPLLGPLLERARVRRIVHPGDARPEDRYIASPALAEFIRCRDMTCRFPNCDEPATVADIDHTVPYPVGPTHASNIKCLCRFHHLLKTFWCGPFGWRDVQLPDGTVIWRSPTGHTYTTHPGSRIYFPSLCRPTGILWDGDPPTVEPTERRGAMMPRRRYTRAQDRARAIAAERKLNAELRSQENEPGYGTDPPF